jgi:hypothetical protein
MITASEQAAKEKTSLWKYISEGKNPSVNVILMEDSCAVLGCVVAGVCMGNSYLKVFFCNLSRSLGLTQMTGNHLFDASGKIQILFEFQNSEFF